MIIYVFRLIHVLGIKVSTHHHAATTMTNQLIHMSDLARGSAGYLLFIHFSTRTWATTRTNAETNMIKKSVHKRLFVLNMKDFDCLVLKTFFQISTFI